MDPRALCALGHLATWAQLRERGVGARQLERAVSGGAVLRARRGTYSCAHLDEPIRIAAAFGAALGCVSVLAQAGVWSGHDRRLHLVVPPGSSAATPTRGTRLHWCTPRFGLDTPLLVTPLEALWRAIHCLPEEHAIAAMESAVFERFLSAEQVMRLRRLAPRRLRDGIRRLDFASQSGNETITRLRLQRAGHHVVSQPLVPGMGHGDLLVDDVIGLDVDSRIWHGEDRFALDRDRDLHVEGFGRHVLRLAPSHIHESWPDTLAVVERLVADARRERQRRSGRVLLRLDDPY